MLKRSDKEQLVAELAENLRETRSVVVFAFDALSMAESTVLRRELRSHAGRLQVVPKRLFQRVCASLEWPARLAEAANSLAIAWAGDLLAPAKAVHGYVRRSEGAQILGGVLEGAVLEAADVERLAILPPLEVLRGQFVGVLAGPVRGFVGVLVGVLRGLPAVLQAQATKST